MGPGFTGEGRCAAGARPGGERPCCRRAGGSGRGALVEPAAFAALLNGGAHGYDVRREIGELMGGDLEVDPGGLYRVLRRLEDEGLVVSAWVEGDSGPQRRDYELTPDGRKVARDWLVLLRERERLAGRLAGVLETALGDTAASTGNGEPHV